MIRQIAVLPAIAIVATCIAGCDPGKPGPAPAENRIKTAARQTATSYDIYEPPRTPTLFAAVKADDVYEVDRHIVTGVNINTRNDRGLTALHLAAKAGQVYMVEHLLARGADAGAGLPDSPAVTPHVLASMSERWDVTALFREKLSEERHLNIHVMVAHGDLPGVKEKLRENPLLLREELPTKRTPLFMAVMANQVEVADYLMKKGARGNPMDIEGDTLVTAAARYGNREMLQFLMDKGYGINTPARYGETALYREVERGDPNDIVDFLVDLGADVNKANDKGRTPLHAAYLGGYTDLAAHLLELGAEVNPQDMDGHTPLHLIAEQGNLEMAKVLLGHGAAVGVTDYDGECPIHVAARRGDLGIVKLLIENGASVSEGDKNGCLPAHFAAYHGHQGVLEYLLANGTDIECRNKKRDTLLHMAAESGHVDIIEFLLANGLEVDAPGAFGRTPLFVALGNNQLEAAKLLQNHGANPSAMTRRGRTPIFAAVQNPRDDLMKLLLPHGVDINLKDKQGRAPLHYAAEYGSLATVQLLLREGAAGDVGPDKDGSTPLHLAAPRGDLQMVKLLLMHGADPNARDADGRTPMHYAAESGRWGAAQLMVQKGAEVDIADKDGVTPVHLAALGGHIRMLNYLIERHVDIHALTNNGDTALEWVINRLERMSTKKNLDMMERGLVNNLDRIKVLLRAYIGREIVGAVNSGDCERVTRMLSLYPWVVDGKRHYRTALTTAVYADNLDMVELLVAHGADPTIPDSRGDTPHETAKKRGYSEIADLLEEYENTVREMYRFEEENKTFKHAAKDAAAPEFERRRKMYYIKKRRSIAEAVLAERRSKQDTAEQEKESIAAAEARKS